MPNEKITFSRGPSTSMPTELVPGQFLVQTDTGNMFLDNTTDPSTGRVQIKDNTKVPLDGSVAMTGALNVGNNKVINLATPTENTDAVNKAYVDIEFQALESEFASTIAGYLPLKGGTMDGDIVVPEDNKITLNNTPVADTDAVNKSYVDSTINNAVGDITDFGIDSNGGTGYASLEALQQAHPTGEVGIFYLVTSSDPSTNNAFDEYFWVPDSSGTSGSYEYAGTFGTVDTSTLATKTELQDGLANKLNVNGQSVTGNFEVTASGIIDLNSTNEMDISGSRVTLTSAENGIDMNTDLQLTCGTSNFIVSSSSVELEANGIASIQGNEIQLGTTSDNPYVDVLLQDGVLGATCNNSFNINWRDTSNASAAGGFINSVGTIGSSTGLDIRTNGAFRLQAEIVSSTHPTIEVPNSVTMYLGHGVRSTTGNDVTWTDSPAYIMFGAAGGIYCVTNDVNGLNAEQCGWVNVPLASSNAPHNAVNVQYLINNFGSATGIDDGVVGQ